MFRRYSVFCLVLLLSSHLVAQENHSSTLRAELERPYTALFESSDRAFTSRELRSMRSTLERERDEGLRACQKEEKDLRKQLATARKGLTELNQSAPRDNTAMADARKHLHDQIPALEKVIHDKKEQCEHGIPAAFEIKLSKVRLLQRWPKRRDETNRKIEAGLSRQRKYGDIDDIGYRKLVDEQDKDIALGEQALRELKSSRLMPMEFENAAVQRYVRDLAFKIAKSSDLKVPLRVSVVDSPETNAFGLPGGFVFVTSGLLRTCETESELAGVIAREIAHVAARHGSRASKRAILPKLVVPAAQVATGFLTGGISNGAYYGMSYGFQGLGILVDKTFERSKATSQKEADQLGMQYAWKAGFDPKGYIAYLDSLAKAEEYSKTERFFLSKPAIDRRLIDAFTELQYLPRRENSIVDSPEFRRAKEESKSNALSENFRRDF